MTWFFSVPKQVLDRFNAGSSKGRTPAFEAEDGGSSPPPAAELEFVREEALWAGFIAGFDFGMKHDAWPSNAELREMCDSRFFAAPASPASAGTPTSRSERGRG